MSADNAGVFAEGGLHLGPLLITNTVLTTWGIMAVLIAAAWLIGRRLREQPDGLQTAVEGPWPPSRTPSPGCCRITRATCCRSSARCGCIWWRPT